MTAEQWALVQPLLSPAPSGALPRRPGRPPPDLRAVLDAVLWKISHQQPWYTLPVYLQDTHLRGTHLRGTPSWQTCYRYYRKWQRSGLLGQVYHTLYQDLVQRGGLDLPAALASGSLSFKRRLGRWVLNVDPSWQDTWQFETARLFLALAARRLPRPRRRRASSLLSKLALVPLDPPFAP